jgi:diguanylate cyclase
MSKTPNVIAQTVLVQLRALGRPPTPEHYTDLYCQLAGEPNPFDALGKVEKVETSASRAPEVSPLCLELLGMMQEQVSAVMETTGQLSEDLGERNGELSRNVDGLKQARQREEVLRLLTLVITQASGIQHSVDTSHKELVKTRQTLQSMRKELTDTRKQLNEDALTGALNRRGMDQTLLREISGAQRRKTPLALAMLDIDHFKQINDSHGHEVGDQALVHFSAVTRSILRGSDTFVRYGGEEFVLILPETDLRGSRLVLARLQEVVAKSPLRIQDKTVSFSFSAGLALFKDDENGHSLLRRADEALYTAKQAGRNCIKVAE